MWLEIDEKLAYRVLDASSNGSDGERLDMFRELATEIELQKKYSDRRHFEMPESFKYVANEFYRSLEDVAVECGYTTKGKSLAPQMAGRAFRICMRHGVETLEDVSRLDYKTITGWDSAGQQIALLILGTVHHDLRAALKTLVQLS